MKGLIVGMDQCPRNDYCCALPDTDEMKSESWDFDFHDGIDMIKMKGAVVERCVSM
jgi:hypothetical protein